MTDKSSCLLLENGRFIPTGDVELYLQSLGVSWWRLLLIISHDWYVYAYTFSNLFKLVGFFLYKYKIIYKNYYPIFGTVESIINV